MVHVPPRNTVWPSPAGISSSFSVQPAAALPPGYWCSARTVRSLLSEEKQRVGKLMQILSKEYNLARFGGKVLEV